jgi:hypothetical protein
MNSNVKLFISYALPHCTTEMVKDVFDTVFNNEVTQIEELTKTDRDTGKPFKLFWITLEPARHSPVWHFVGEIEKWGKLRIIYESSKHRDFYLQVRLNKEKTITKTVPRIMPAEELEPGQISEKRNISNENVKVTKKAKI